QYTTHTTTVSEEITLLITEAQSLLLTLSNLESRMETIHSLCLRNDLHIQGSKQEIMSQLWTLLGGNRQTIDRFNSQLQLLGQVNGYRQSALAHVTGMMVRLQAMGAELEDLRERAGGVELLVGTGAGGKGGIPLQVHIENIELGVERLEQRRNWAKQLENEQVKKALSYGNKDERREIGA
ncbi:MAG: hypothetical protein Q9190_006528, partial [Brigantiaea leucoxantha]